MSGTRCWFSGGSSPSCSTPGRPGGVGCFRRSGGWVLTRARALRTVPWVQPVFRPGARPRRVETGVRCRDCRDLHSPGAEAGGARRVLDVGQGRCRLLGDEGGGARLRWLVNEGRCRLRDVEGGGARRGPLKPAEALDVEGAEARRWWLVGDEGSSRTMCHLKLLTMYTVSLVRLTGSSSTRVVAAARRRRGTPGLLVDEGGRGSPRWLDVDEGGALVEGR